MYDELYHYGIKGQKWGVRRFQNVDGTYTQKGAARRAEKRQAYLDTKASYKQGKSTKADVQKAKGELRAANKKLREDVRADRGKELYKRGRTVEANKVRQSHIYTAAGLVGSSAAALYTQGMLGKKATVYTLGATAAIAAGTSFVSGVQNRRMRTYHNTSVKNA